MSLKPINPESGRPIGSLQEYDRVADQIARQAAGLPAYDMEDPQRPFTEEYDPPSQLEVAAETADASVSPHAKALQEKVERIHSKLHAKEAAVDVDVSEREDPWASLGGGHNTYHQEGLLPTGLEQDAVIQVARGRGGRLVHRVMLAGKFIDVPVSEHGSNAPQIETAKQRLVRGGGQPVSKLNRKNKRS